MTLPLLLPVLLLSGCGSTPTAHDDAPTVDDGTSPFSDADAVSLAPPEEPPPAFVPPAPSTAPREALPPVPATTTAPRLTASLGGCHEPGCDPVITFDHPIVEDLELDLAQVPDIMTEPPQPGTWQWIANNQLQFVSEEQAFSHGSETTISLKGLAPRGFEDDTLGTWSESLWIPEFRVAGKVASWAVQPGKPRFVGFLNHFRFEVGRGPLFLLYDQPVDPEAIGDDLQITDASGRKLPFDIDRPTDVSRAVEQSFDLRHVVAVDLRFDPPRDSTLTIQPPSHQDDPTWDVTVDDQLTMNGWTHYDHQRGTMGPEAPVALDTTLRFDLSDPIEPDRLAQLDIQPPPKHVRGTGSWGYPALALELEPGTRYTIRPSEGAVDALGNPFDPFTIRFRSRDLPPELSVPALPLTSELERPRLELRGRNLARLDVTTYDFNGPEDYVEALSRGARGTCADHGLAGKGQRLPAPTWDVPMNERSTTVVELPGGPGLRCVEVTADSLGTESTGPVTRAVLVQTSDLGATAKVFEGGILHWVTSLSDATPRPNATVRLLGADGQSITKATTDGDGVAVLTDVGDAHGHGVDGTLYVVAEHGDDRLVLKLAEDRLSQPWRFALRGATKDALPLNTALFTERGAYRPGDTVHTTVMAGPEHAGKRSTIEVIDARGQQITESTKTLDAFGVGSISLDLASGAAVGVYKLRATIDGRATSRDFRVEEYRIPTFEIDIDTEASWVRGAPAAAVIGANYLHGGSLDGRAVRYSVTRAPEPFRPPTFPGFQFTDGPPDATAVTLDTGSARLDGQGKRTVRFTPSHPSSTGPMRYTVEASVTDLDRQEYTGRRTEVVHAARFYVGVRPPIADIVSAGDTLEVPIVAVAPDGTAVAGVQVKARLERVDHHQTVRVGTDGSTQTLNREVVADDLNCTVTTTDSASVCTFVVPQSGRYRVRAWARDPDQRDVVAGFELTATGDEPTAWPRFDRERIEVVADKASYAPGDVAKLVVQTPFETATGLLTLERDGIIERRVFTIDEDTPSIDVPITGDMAPNVYASITLLRGRVHDEVDPTGFETGAPAFRLGIAELAVETAEQRLAVNVTPNKDVAIPGSQLSVDLDLKDPSGQPIAGQIAVMVVDEAVLGLTGHRTPDPVAELYPAEPLGVRTADARFELAHAKRARREVLFPGGDGGMIPGQLPTNELRNLFESTAFFDADVPVGPDGKGTVSFELPDNTTTYRIMAVAIDAEGRAGSADDQVTVKLPLMVQPVLPRFVHPGDQLTVSAILHNGTDANLPASVSIAGEGVVFPSEPLTARVPGQGTGTIEIPLTVPEIRDREELVLRYAAVMGEHTDEIEVRIPIREPGVRRKQLVEAAVAGTQELSFTFPDDRVLGTERVEVVASTTALTKLKDSVQYLLRYPNGCIEQTTSTAYPLVVLEDLLPEIGVDVPPEELREYAEAGVRRILSFQTEGGGLSYWPGGTEPHAFATSFGLTALIEAEERGYDVPRESLDRMADYLEDTLRKGDVTESIPHGNIADGDTRALFVMTLGRLGRPQPAALATLWDERAKLTPFGLSFLAIAASEMDGGHPLTEPILAEVRKAAEQDEDSAWYDGKPKGGYSMDSPLRTHASALLAHASGGTNEPMTPRLLEGLLARQRGGLWGNTQENVFGIMGIYTLAAKGNARGKDAPAITMAHNGVEVPVSALESLSRSARRLTLGPDALTDAKQTVTLTARGTPANVTVRAEYDVKLTPENRAPRSAGATIERRYETMDGTELSDRIALGDLVRVRLRVTTDEDLNYVAIDDKLPAGLEPLNTSLATTRTLDMGAASTEVQRGLSQLSYQEVRDHRVAFYADALPAGTVEYQYVARATTPGSFLRPAAGVEAMYDLSTFATSSIDRVTITDGGTK